MARFIIVLLLSLLQIITPSHAGTQAIVKADIIEGIDSVKNYSGQYAHFEKNANGWARYDDGAATPVDCTGTGAGLDNTFERSTNSPLSGDASGLWTKSGATSRQGEGVALPFSIDSKDKGAVLKVQFDYEVSANYADNDIRVWVYDVTNSRVIEPAPNYIKDTLVASAIQPFEFQTSIDSTSYRLCIHQASASALDYTFKLDNVKIGKSAASSGPFISDWQSYTPTFEGSTTDPTIGTGGSAGITGRWRRVGDTMHVEAHARFGTSGTSPGSGTLYLTIPSEYTIDSAKLSTNMNNFNYGHCTVYDSASAANNRVGTIQLGSGGYKWVGCYMNATGNYSSGFAGFSPNANDDEFAIQAIVPIVGWSSNQKLSSDAENRVVAAKVTRSTTQSIPNATVTKLQYNVQTYDTHGGLDTTTNYRYTARVSGWYRVHGQVAFSANATGERYAYIYYNGSTATQHGLNTQGASIDTRIQVNNTLRMNAGDYIEIYAFQNSGGSLNTVADGSIMYWSIDQIQGPEQIAASETVAAVYSKSDATAFAGGSIRVFGTKITDTHNAYSTSTGFFTAPVAGLYQVCASVQTQSVAAVAGQNYRLYFSIAGVTVWGQEYIYPASVNITNHLTACADRYLLAGQQMGVATDGSVAVNFSADATRNWVSFKRIGL